MPAFASDGERLKNSGAVIEELTYERAVQKARHEAKLDKKRKEEYQREVHVARAGRQRMPLEDTPSFSIPPVGAALGHL